MREENNTFKDEAATPPEGWEEKVEGVWSRERARENKTPEDLRELIFLYLTEGRAFGNASALSGMGGRSRLGKKAVYTRLCG
jgi:hypothetical protein